MRKKAYFIKTIQFGCQFTTGASWQAGPSDPKEERYRKSAVEAIGPGAKQMIACELGLFKKFGDRTPG